MTTIAILSHHLKSNATVINMIQCQIAEATAEISCFYRANNPEGARYEEADRAKLRKKLAKMVEMQKRIKVEIAAIYRNERIARKFLRVFGQLPTKQLTTSVEQEAMLDRLLAERKKQDEAVFGVAA